MCFRHIQDFRFRWVRHLPFSVTVAFRATRILSTVEVDILVDCSLQSCQNPDNSKSRCSCSYHKYEKSRRHYASRQLWELTMQLFGATKILSKVGVDIPVDYSLRSYQIPVNSGSGHSCRPLPSKLPKSQQLLELTFLQLSELSNTWKTIYFSSTIGVDNVAFRVTLNLKDTMLRINCQSWQLQLSELQNFCKLRVDIPYMFTVENRKFLVLPQNVSNTFSLHSLY